MIESDKLYLRVAYDVVSGGERRRVDIDDVVKELNRQIVTVVGSRYDGYAERDTGNIVRVYIDLFRVTLRRVVKAMKAVNDDYGARLGIKDIVLDIISYKEGGSDEYSAGVGTFRDQIERSTEVPKLWSASRSGKPRRLAWFKGFDV